MDRKLDQISALIRTQTNISDRQQKPALYRQSAHWQESFGTERDGDEKADELSFEAGLYDRITSSGNSTISNVLDKSCDNPNVNAMTTALDATIVYIKNRFSLSRSMNGWPCGNDEGKIDIWIFISK